MESDFEHETAPEVYSSAREQASHLFGLPRPSGIGVKTPVQLAGDVGGRSIHDQRGVRAAECCDRRGAVLRNPHRRGESGDCVTEA